MNQAHRTNVGSNSVSEFHLRFDKIRKRQVIIKLIERFFFNLKLMSTNSFQFLWRPYIQNEVSRLIMVDIPLVARAIVPIVCFTTTVEIHQADRVTNQFGLRQNILPDPINLDQVHKDGVGEMKEIGWYIITSTLQFGMTDKIGSFKVHRLAETVICVIKHPTCSGTQTILSAIYLQIFNLLTMRSVLLQCCTSVYHAYLFMAMALLFIL